MKTNTQNLHCPRRLYDEAVLFNKMDIPVWVSRRANKMRERFVTEEPQPIETLSLIAPVQPSPRNPSVTSAAIF